MRPILWKRDDQQLDKEDVPLLLPTAFDALEAGWCLCRSARKLLLSLLLPGDVDTTAESDDAHLANGDVDDDVDFDADADADGETGN